VTGRAASAAHDNHVSSAGKAIFAAARRQSEAFLRSKVSVYLALVLITVEQIEASPIFLTLAA